MVFTSLVENESFKIYAPCERCNKIVTLIKAIIRHLTHQSIMVTAGTESLWTVKKKIMITDKNGTRHRADLNH